jgi:translation initiation factor 2D
MLFDSKQYVNKFRAQLNFDEYDNDNYDNNNYNNNNNVSPMNDFDIRVGGYIHRQKLLQLFDKYMDIYSAIEFPNMYKCELKYKKGEPAMINVSVDKRKGRKFMTHVLGLEEYHIDYKQFSQMCRTKLASSTSIGELYGKKNQLRNGRVRKEVLIQGNWSKSMPELIEQQYGLPRTLVKANAAVTKLSKNK